MHRGTKTYRFRRSNINQKEIPSKGSTNKNPSTNVELKTSEPTSEMLKKEIAAILRREDHSKMTSKNLRVKLTAKFNTDLQHRRLEIDELMMTRVRTLREIQSTAEEGAPLETTDRSRSVQTSSDTERFVINLSDSGESLDGPCPRSNRKTADGKKIAAEKRAADERKIAEERIAVEKKAAKKQRLLTRKLLQKRER